MSTNPHTLPQEVSAPFPLGPTTYVDVDLPAGGVATTATSEKLPTGYSKAFVVVVYTFKPGNIDVGLAVTVHRGNGSGLVQDASQNYVGPEVPDGIAEAGGTFSFHLDLDHGEVEFGFSFTETGPATAGFEGHVKATYSLR
jgi:hypothetical protein